MSCSLLATLRLRSLPDWKQSDSAAKAGLSLTELNNIERGATDLRASTLAAIQLGLEAAGVVCIDENGGGPGVRLKREVRR